MKLFAKPFFRARLFPLLSLRIACVQPASCSFKNYSDSRLQLLPSTELTNPRSLVPIRRRNLGAQGAHSPLQKRFPQAKFRKNPAHLPHHNLHAQRKPFDLLSPKQRPRETSAVLPPGWASTVKPDARCAFSSPQSRVRCVVVAIF